VGSSRRWLRLLAVLGLAVCIGAGFAVGDASAKKKKHKTASVFAATVSPNLAVPDRPPAGHELIASSTLTVGKKFKGKTVGDLNVTGIRTTGDTASSAGHLNMMLVAPNGRAVLVDDQALGGQSIGPLTFDDDTATSICDSTTPVCSDPDATLLRPFAGTANLANTFGGDTGPLSVFNGVPMKGTWTFLIWDAQVSQTSVLNGWGLQITAARPVT
jgi:hypothetical protein